MSNSTMEDTRAVLTGEEVIVFAAGRNLPMPTAVVDLPVMRLQGEALQQRLVDAMKVLLTRGVSPQPPVAGVEDPPLAQMLQVVCDPEASMAITRTEGPALFRADFSTRQGRIVKLEVSEIGLFALAEVEPDRLHDELVECTGLVADDSPTTARADRVKVEVPGFTEAAAAGADALATALEAVLPAEHAGAAAAIADAMDASLPCRAVFSRSETETIALIWVDAGTEGLWALALEPDGTALFELMTPADVRAALADGVQFATARE